MKAEIKPRINLEGRTRLETVVPLSTPYLIFVDPSSLCNAKCSFCPTGIRENRKYYTPGLMNLELYKKIINDLCRMPEIVKTLRLYKDGESLLNPEFPEMVRYAKDTGRFGQVDVTSNGLLLKAALSIKLIDSGLDKIFISVPRGYPPSYVRNVRKFYYLSRGKCQVYVKAIGDWMLPKNREEFMADFGDISDRIFIENRINCWPEFDSGNDPPIGIYGNPITDIKVCPYPLYSLSINHDGTVSTCYLDWPHNMILGDLKKESFRDIWYGDKLRDFRIMQLKEYRNKHPFCKNCHQLTHGSPDNVDPYAKFLLDKLTEIFPKGG